jgi:hypothetical protein
MNSHDSNSTDKPPCARFERKMMLLELGRSQAIVDRNILPLGPCPTLADWFTLMR